MKYIEEYEKFMNEEFNWKKAVAGAALVGSLSMPSCKSHSYLYMDINKQEPVEMETSNSLCRVLQIKNHKNHSILSLSTEEGDEKEIMLDGNPPIKEGDRIYLIMKGSFGHVMHKSGKYDLITDEWCKNFMENIKTYEEFLNEGLFNIMTKKITESEIDPFGEEKGDIWK